MARTATPDRNIVLPPGVERGFVEPWPAFDDRYIKPKPAFLAFPCADQNCSCFQGSLQHRAARWYNGGYNECCQGGPGRQ